ncbi:MAG TPA: D-alanine--D-alanine ligase [Crocinitomicaceae bacterium]|nr:D-alanine--D-alanine ligase [Crocinitomicaceae bacterium]
MKKIAIICGGYSSEFEISLKSGKTILDNFPKEFDAFLIELTTDSWTAIYNEKRYVVDPWSLSFQTENGQIKADAAIIYIHGNPGENGRLQALFEMQNIPFVNSGGLASHLSFDKWYCNQFLNNFGIKVAKSLFLRSENQFTAEHIVSELGLPCFVKPTDSGSSFGISKVNTQAELQPALEKAFAEGKSVVIESFLKGTEVTCAVYQTKNGLKALPLTEIVSENDFFDYEAKYLGKSQEITPARVDETLKNKVQAVAKDVYQLLNLRSIARVDFMVVDNEPYVIEVNTTPGFSPASLVPQMLACEGIKIEDFWREIVSFELAL